MTTRPADLSMRSTSRGAGRTGPRSGGPGSRLARYALPVFVAVTVCIALAGGLVALQVFTGSTHTRAADGRVPTSFGALWVDSSREVAVPQTVHKGHIGFPQAGPPEKVLLEVVVRLANTTRAAVELTPARFTLRLERDSTPISAEGAAFESVRLLPGAIFEAQMQFPVKGGEHELSLLFDDPDGSGPIAIDLGRARFPETAGTDHEDH